MIKIKPAILSLLLIVTIVFIQQACVSHDFPKYTCPDQPVSFALDIQPIISTRCAIPTCHNGDNGADKNWTDFSLFQAKARSGEVKRRVVNRIMPPSDSPGGPLTQEQINMIACWSDQGAQNN